MTACTLTCTYTPTHANRKQIVQSRRKLIAWRKQIVQRRRKQIVCLCCVYNVSACVSRVVLGHACTHALT